jgi:Lrp/AsnC family transcriptional regulator, regulator for asnA, asnC and gidA
METFGRYVRAGLTGGLGTDSCPHDMMEEMSWAAVVWRYRRRGERPGPRRPRATRARLQGRPGAGAVRDPIKSLVDCNANRCMDTVLVDGRVVVRDGRVPGADEADLCRRVRAAQTESLADTATRDWAGRDECTLSPLSLPLWDGEAPTAAFQPWSRPPPVTFRFDRRRQIDENRRITMRTRRIPQRLDHTDVEIIRMLQADARRPNTDIARRLGIAETTVRNRIERLTREGVVQCGAWTDPLKIGYQTYAIIQIQVAPPRLEKVAEVLAGLPEVFFLGIATGGFDIVAAAVFRSNEHLYELMTKRFARIAGIQRTSTLGIVRIVKRAYSYPVPAIEPAAASDSPAPRKRRGPAPPPRKAAPSAARAARQPGGAA